MLNIVVPMAGRGSRFSQVGYELPKPLIEIRGVPMIQLVVSNLRPASPHRFVFLCLQEHLASYPVASVLRQVAPDCEIVIVEGITQGAACTVLLAKDLINSADPLMIANCDQWVDTNVDDYLAHMSACDADGLIMTMRADDPKWSFVKFNEQSEIIEVVEKQVVSNEATVGIYNFRSGQQFVSGAESMIRQDLRVNNEFYVAPVYNELIRDGGRIAYYNIGSEGHGMYGIGVPADLEKFLLEPASERALAQFHRRANRRAA